ncbi:MAG: hypothetical protein QXT19_02835 [Candidatus Woesearchaeota archaeon]
MGRCVHCKSLKHAEENCPLYAKARARMKVAQKLTRPEFFGSAPSPFIGRFGYPDVHVGILTPPEERENAWLYDAPNYWSLSDYNVPQIVDLRSALVNSRFRANVRERRHQWLELVQEVGMASRPVEVELSLKDVPRFRLQADAFAPPMGPNAELARAKITSNPRIPKKIDKVVSDTDLKAEAALTGLYDKGIGENALSKLLSTGVLGVKEQRKLVPTRWSITATDDVLGKHLIAQLKDFDFADYSVFYGNYLGNHYIVCLFPDFWSYELFEVYLPGDRSQFATDYEPFSGRTEYAFDTTGGYYTPRLAVAEKLKEMKRQASVLVLRFITEEYTLPLGVWVTREASRKAVAKKPILFSSKELLLNYVRLFVKKRFNYDADFLLAKSRLLKNLGKQQRLSSFI